MILCGRPREVAVKSTGISLRTYDNYKKAYAQRGIVGLEERSRKPYDIRKPTWLTQVYEAVVNDRKTHPTEGREVTHDALNF